MRVSQSELSILHQTRGWNSSNKGSNGLEILGSSVEQQLSQFPSQNNRMFATMGTIGLQSTTTGINSKSKSSSKKAKKTGWKEIYTRQNSNEQRNETRNEYVPFSTLRGFVHSIFESDSPAPFAKKSRSFVLNSINQKPVDAFSTIDKSSKKKSVLSKNPKFRSFYEPERLQVTDNFPKKLPFTQPVHSAVQKEHPSIKVEEAKHLGEIKPETKKTPLPFFQSKRNTLQNFQKSSETIGDYLKALDRHPKVFSMNETKVVMASDSPVVSNPHSSFAATEQLRAFEGKKINLLRDHDHEKDQISSNGFIRRAPVSRSRKFSIVPGFGVGIVSRKQCPTNLRLNTRRSNGTGDNSGESSPFLPNRHKMSPTNKRKTDIFSPSFGFNGKLGKSGSTRQLPIEVPLRNPKRQERFSKEPRTTVNFSSNVYDEVPLHQSVSGSNSQRRNSKNKEKELKDIKSPSKKPKTPLRIQEFQEVDGNKEGDDAKSEEEAENQKRELALVLRKTQSEKKRENTGLENKTSGHKFNAKSTSKKREVMIYSMRHSTRKGKSQPQYFISKNKSEHQHMLEKLSLLILQIKNQLRVLHEHPSEKSNNEVLNELLKNCEFLEENQEKFAKNAFASLSAKEFSAWLSPGLLSSLASLRDSLSQVLFSRRKAAAKKEQSDLIRWTSRLTGRRDQFLINSGSSELISFGKNPKKEEFEERIWEYLNQLESLSTGFQRKVFIRDSLAKYEETNGKMQWILEDGRIMQELFTELYEGLDRHNAEMSLITKATLVNNPN